MSSRQVSLTSPEQDLCTPFSSFKESSTNPLMDNVDEDINDVVNDIGEDNNWIDIEVVEDENNPFEKKKRKRTSKV